MDEAQVRSILLAALTAVLNERPRLNIQVGERALAFRLGFHLQGMIPGYVIDSEYNYDVSGEGSKKVRNAGRLRELAAKVTGAEQRDLKCVTPDLIVHRRTAGARENIVVIEVKWDDLRWTNDDKDFDREKLRAIKAEFRYQHAVFLLLPRDPARFSRPQNIEFIWSA